MQQSNTFNYSQPATAVSDHHETANSSSPSVVNNNSSPSRFNIKPSPVFTIDLNTPPRQRWKPIVAEYLEKMKPLKGYIDKMADEQAGWFGKLGMKLSGWGAKQLLTTISDEVVEELEGIAELTEEAFGLTFSDLLNLNLGYNFLAMCSSIAVKEEGDDSLGGVTHLRNLDWDKSIADPFRDLTVDVNWVRGERLIYRCTTWVGFNGTMTGLRFRQPENEKNREAKPFSISLNYRKDPETSFELVGFVTNILAGFLNYYPAEYMIRKLLEDADSMETALKWIDEYPLMAPCYLLICGESNSVLLSKTRRSDLNRQHLNDQPTISQRKFLIQTNIDHWVDKVDPKWALDDELLQNSVERRCAARTYLSQNVKDFSKLNLHEKTTHEQLNEFLEKTKMPDGEAMFNTDYFNFSMQCISNYPSCNNETVFQVVCNAHNNFYYSRIIFNPPTDDSNNFKVV